MIFQLCAFVAQTTSPLLPSTTQAAAAQSPLGTILTSPMTLIAIAGVLFYVMVMRGNKKQEKAKKDRLSSLKKNDRVMTIGGILGTIVEVRDKEVVVKVDETNNTKMRFSRDAIRSVVEDEEKT